MAAVAAVIATTAAGLAACGSEDSGGGGTEAFTMTVGALDPLTGPLASLTPASSKSGDVAVALLQEALKKAGSNIKVELEHADSQGDPQAAVAAARKLSSDGASCLTGPWGSAETIAVNEGFARTLRVPVVAIGSSPEISGLKDRDYLFRSLASDAVQGQAMAQLMAKKLGNSDGVVSVAARNDAYGQGIADAFSSAWQALGGKVQGPVLYDTAQPSYDSEAADIVQDDPDGYLIADFPDPFAKVAAALVRTGKFDASKAVLSDGLAFPSGLPAGVPEQAVAGSSGTVGLADGPGLKTYQALFDQMPGTKDSGPYEYNNADGVIICALAAVAAGSNKPQEIAEHIKDVASPPGAQYSAENLSDAIKALAKGDDIDYQGIAGTSDMDDAGDQLAAVYQVFNYTGSKFAYTGEKLTAGKP